MKKYISFFFLFTSLIFFSCASQNGNSSQQAPRQQQQRQQTVPVETRTNEVFNIINYYYQDQSDYGIFRVYTGSRQRNNYREIKVRLNTSLADDKLANYFIMWAKQVRLDPRRIRGNLVDDNALLEFVLNDGRVHYVCDIMRDDVARYSLSTDWKNSIVTSRPQQPQRIQDTSKLTALLLNPLSASFMGQFQRGEKVFITRAFLRVIDLQQNGNSYRYLVMINDNNIQKPFYINTNRMLNLIDVTYRHTIFEDLTVSYVGTDNYRSNGITYETFVFQLSE